MAVPVVTTAKAIMKGRGTAGGQGKGGGRAQLGIGLVVFVGPGKDRRASPGL